MNKYDDIINLPHYVSKTRPKMSKKERAAQFSPYSALTICHFSLPSKSIFAFGAYCAGGAFFILFKNRDF